MKFRILIGVLLLILNTASTFRHRKHRLLKAGKIALEKVEKTHSRQFQVDGAIKNTIANEISKSQEKSAIKKDTKEHKIDSKSFQNLNTEKTGLYSQGKSSIL